MKLINLLKNFFTFIGQLLILAFLGFCAKGSWQAYVEEKQATLAEKEGIPLTVRLTKVSNEHKIWKDYIGNSRYVSFDHEGKEYTLRYIQDTIFLQEGVRVPVLYHAPADVFVQPGMSYHRKQNIKTSPLTKWTVLALFNGPQIWLFAFIALFGLFILLLTNALGTWTGIGLLQKLGSLIIFLCAIGGAVFFTYDALKYFQYYQHLKSKGVSETVGVDELHRVRRGRSTRSDVWELYDYEADVRFKGELRIIAISQGDFSGLKRGDVMNVKYDPAIDDMMSVNYSLSYTTLIFPFVIWAFVIFFTYKRVRSWSGNVSLTRSPH